jgi:hypothetical protein
MTVNEMIERLQEAVDDGFGECEVRLAFQPSWPLQFEIGGVATPDDESRATSEPDEEPNGVSSVVYITEGSHPRDDSPYAPSWAFAAAR